MKKERLSILKGAQSYQNFYNPDKCVLCIHGFSGNPAEMRYFANRMEAEGFSVSVPRLPGHGTSVDDMSTTNGRDWYLAAREAYLECSSFCKEVFIAGLSMGGVLSLLLASEFHPAGLALVSTPYTIADWKIYTAPLIGHFVKILPNTNPTKGINEEATRLVHVSYSSGVPMLSVWELHKLIKKGMACLPQVCSPTIVVQSLGDETIPCESAAFIIKNIGSSVVDTYEVIKSNHVILCDYDREEVSSEIVKFFNTCSSRKS